MPSRRDDNAALPQPGLCIKITKLDSGTGGLHDDAAAWLPHLTPTGDFDRVGLDGLTNGEAKRTRKGRPNVEYLIAADTVRSRVG